MLNSRVSIIGAVAASVMMASSAAQAGSHSVPKLPCETAQLIVPWKPGGALRFFTRWSRKLLAKWTHLTI